MDEKCSLLSDVDYLFWAYIYVMALSSKETEKIAFDLVAEPERDIARVSRIFQEEMNWVIGRKKLVVISDLEMGQRIMGTHLDLIETREEGVSAADFSKVTGLRYKRSITKGSILTWNDIEQSYERMRYGRD